MALMILGSGERVTVGGTVTVFGTQEGAEQVSVLFGTITLSGAFASGGDTLILPDPPEAYTARLVGSQVVIEGPGLSVAIPVGTVGMAIRFEGGDEITLRYDVSAGQYRLGNQIVTQSAVAVDLDAPPPVSIPGANATVQLDDDALPGGNAGGSGDGPDRLNASGTLAGGGGEGALAYAFETNGAPAGFTYQLSGSTLLVKQGATTVLTVTLDPATGAFSVLQNAPIDHLTGGGENDQLFTIAYRVTDGTSSATGSLEIAVDDDSPVASPDTAALAEGDPSVTGDVLSGSDRPGADGGIVSSVSSVNQPGMSDSQADASGNLQVAGQYGTLTLNRDGSFTYERSSSPTADVVERFNYVLTDGDGDSASATLSIAIAGTGAVEATPVIAETAAANDAVASAQSIGRSSLAIASNPLLPDDDLPSVTIEGALSANGDKDFFKIHLEEGELLVLDVDQSVGALDPLLRLYAPDGTQIGEVDDVRLDPGSDPANYDAEMTWDPALSFRAPQSGTYYFSVESWNLASSGSYDLHVSVGPPADEVILIAEDIAAVQSGYAWQSGSVTYSFPSQPSQYPAGSHGGEIDNEFEAFSVAQRGAVAQVLNNISAAADLDFTLVALNPGTANLRYAMSDEPETAYAYYPTGSAVGGSLWFNNSSGDYDNPIAGNYAWITLIHETGHALGLKHPHEDIPLLRLDRDSMEYTVMSYRSHPAATVDEDSGYTNETWGFAQTLMMYDIAALQQMYGPNFAHNAGDTVYSWNPVNGQTLVDGGVWLSPGANRVFMTIWDGGGEDTYDLSNYVTGTRIDLRPGEWTLTSLVQLANLGDGHFATGNVANALQFEGDPRSLIENAIGGSSNDTLIANAASNELTGGAGNDVFRWYSVDDADAGLPADLVADFARGADRIDLSAIDAVEGGSTNEAFTFIGNSGFSGTAGELRYQASGNSLLVQADVNGDGAADLHILLNNLSQVGSADFLL